MRKLLAILLALAMVMSLAACGSEPADDDKKDKDDKKEVVETTEETTEEETTEPVTDEFEGSTRVESAADLTRGTIKGHVYKNESLDIEFEKPKAWTYMTDEQISAMLNMSGVFDTDVDNLLEELGSFIDMGAMDFTTGEGVIILLENPEAYIGINSEEDYLDSVMSNRESMGSGLSLVGEYEDVTLGSHTYKKALLEDELMKQAYYIDYVNDYLICIIVTVVNRDVSDVEAMFS